MKIDERMPAAGSIEKKDPFAMAPPGYGLTLDNSRWPWGQPPTVVNPEQAFEEAVNSLEQKKTKQELMKLLLVGASVEALVEGYVFQKFSDGGFSPDVGLLIKGPLSLYIANMAEEEGILYRFFENDDERTKDEMNDETFFRMLKENNPGMFSFIREQINEGIRQGTAPKPPEEENFLNSKGKQ